MNRIILKLLLAVLPAMLALTACEKDYDGKDLLTKYDYELAFRFVNSKGEPPVEHFDIASIESYFHRSDITEPTGKALPLRIFVDEDGMENIIFGFSTNDQHPSVTHWFEWRDYYGKTQTFKAEMVSHWRFDNHLTGRTEPVSVTYNGHDFPVEKIVCNSAGKPETIGRVTIVLPDQPATTPL